MSVLQVLLFTILRYVTESMGSVITRSLAVGICAKVWVARIA
ncbi:MULTISPECIES: hypothetical protein [Arthrospira]|nr:MULTISPECIES: hypothetical protein [Arthrospira]MDF2212002.1 hypothetical protein [Arthrospira platensis NCB002]MDT9184896.1 hypothetical protein [Limnospira sp. PMC 289.06]MDT9296472.1 hypothetical protein [Arthrospira platensis PCC 7345]MDT9312537.1 hypothetical protein [Limnospira sp. Paracas R14]WAK73815.1 hypothetical protein AP9108_35550 [Arthrospira sp. PCC 9108]